MTEHDTAAAPTRPAVAADDPLRRAARHAYRWLLLGFLGLCAVQIFLAGLGVFSLQDASLGGAAGDRALAPHRDLGFALGALAVLILVSCLVARPGARDAAGAAVLVVLANLVQSLLAGLADQHAVYGGLHAAGGLAIIAVAAWLYARARRRGAADLR